MSLKALTICAFFYMQDNHVLDIKQESVDLICQNAELIVEHSEKNNVSTELVLSLMWSESRFEPTKISKVGACGLLQIIPRWASDNQTCSDLQVPLINIAEGTKQLNFWINEFGKGSTEKGLCGYAAGYKCHESTKAQKYAKHVLSKSKRLKKKLEKLEKLISQSNSLAEFIIQKFKI